MKYARKFRLIMISMVVVLFLVACGDTEDTSTDGEVTDTGEASGEQITLRISWWGNDDRHRATLDAIEAFEADYPDINVEAEYAGWDGIVERTATQITGGTEPDVMQINYDWYLDYSPTGEGFYDLNELTDHIDLSGYDEMTLESGTIEGKLNGIPLSNNSTVLMLNKTVYDELGIDYTELKSWEDYLEIADQFPDGSYPMTFEYEWFQIHTYLTQLTGKPFLDYDGNILYTQDEIQQGYEFYLDLIENEVIPSKGQMTESLGQSHPSTATEFLQGEFAGMYDWVAGSPSYNAMLEEQGYELVIPSYPTIEGAENNGVMLKPSMLFSISKNTDYPVEAATLLNYLINEPEGVMAMGTARSLPANQNAVEILDENGQLDELTHQVIDYMEETTGVTQSPYFENAALMQEYNYIAEALDLGQLTPEEASEELITRVETVIESMKQ